MCIYVIEGINRGLTYCYICNSVYWPRLKTCTSYSTEHKSIGKLTATAPQPFYNVLLFLRTLCIVWSPVRRRVTRRLTRLKTMYNVLKSRKTWCNNGKISFTGTGAQPHRNRKLIHFDYAQYCRSANSVAPFISANEQSQSNRDCSFNSSIAFLPPGDHITINYTM